jgi:hypothetical protein
MAENDDLSNLAEYLADYQMSSPPGDRDGPGCVPLFLTFAAITAILLLLLRMLTF